MYKSGGVVKGGAVQFELLFIDGCPSWRQAVENLRQALRSEGPDMEISLIRVEGAGNAHELQFQGSPTIRLSGKDLFPDQPGQHGYSCRIYQTEEGLQGWPTINMIRERLQARKAVDTPHSEGYAASGHR